MVESERAIFFNFAGIKVAYLRCIFGDNYVVVLLVNDHMALQIARLCEAFRADRTRVGLLSGVNSGVFLECGSITKSLCAQTAPICFLLSMSPQMNQSIRVIAEFFDYKLKRILIITSYITYNSYYKVVLTADGTLH